METNKQLKELSIKELFNSEDEYVIPIYQRNYAWGRGEVEQLVIDINDFAKEKSDKNYYIGTLVVFHKDKNLYETIDGQQRLTTLSILLSVLNIEFKHLLKYESREISTKTLEYIYNRDIEQENLNTSMENAYKTIEKSLHNIDDLENFKRYLLENVKILRVEVPKDTDLNHYFEIMNNRGEQLEKHEVLKARLIEKLSDNNDKVIFNKIWEACSDMNRYIQYAFLVEERNKLFGDKWDNITYNNFDDIVTKIQNNEATDNEAISIDDIIAEPNRYIIDNKKHDNDSPDRFNSPINFPNFLLHVLKVTKSEEIPLDDKRLLESFEKDLDENFVKEFGYNLFKLRFLFDNYIIKREYTSDKDEWSLKQVYKYKNKKQVNIQYKNRFDDEINKKIIMILSMFHVSNPSQIYKYWLTGVLKFLHKNGSNIDAQKYLKYLEELAKKFLYLRYLAKEPVSFEELIFNVHTINNENIDEEKLNEGTSVEHFIFNYLDYLLWKNNTDKFNYFIFSFSNSVEHFYPQNPIDGHGKLDKNYLDNFGNLCLISTSKNSKLTNHPPKSKKEYYPNKQYDSLKQHIMMEEADNWNEKDIQEHAKDMKDILISI